jgi:surface antigen
MRSTAPPRERAVAVKRWLTGAVLLATATVGFAANLDFLRNTPITYMWNTDRKSLNAAAQNALNTKKDGESLSWSNAGTGNPVSITGSITPHDTSTNGPRTCRKATLVLNAKGQTQTWTPTVCKEGSEPWKILKQ